MNKRKIEAEINNKLNELKNQMKARSKEKRNKYLSDYKKRKYKQKVYYVPIECDDPDRFVFEKLKEKFLNSQNTTS